MMDKYQAEFFCSYVETALWSSNDNADDSGGEPLDANYSDDDIDPAALEEMRRECASWVRRNIRNLILSGLDAGRAGHNFWLNRNGHGAGFWDERYDDSDERRALMELSKASKWEGTCDLYVNEGKIYVS